MQADRQRDGHTGRQTHTCMIYHPTVFPQHFCIHGWNFVRHITLCAQLFLWWVFAIWAMGTCQSRKPSRHGWATLHISQSRSENARDGENKEQYRSVVRSRSRYEIGTRLKYITPWPSHPRRRSLGRRSRSQEVDWDTPGPTGPTSTNGPVCFFQIC